MIKEEHVGEHTSSERHDSCPQVAGVEWHVNAGKRDCGESTLQFDVALCLVQVFRALVAGVDDICKHGLDLVDGELLSELLGLSVICSYISAQDTLTFCRSIFSTLR